MIEEAVRRYAARLATGLPCEAPRGDLRVDLLRIVEGTGPLSHAAASLVTLRHLGHAHPVVIGLTRDGNAWRGVGAATEDPTDGDWDALVVEDDWFAVGGFVGNPGAESVTVQTTPSAAGEVSIVPGPFCVIMPKAGVRVVDVVVRSRTGTTTTRRRLLRPGGRQDVAELGVKRSAAKGAVPSRVAFPHPPPWFAVRRTNGSLALVSVHTDVWGERAGSEVTQHALVYELGDLGKLAVVTRHTEGDGPDWVPSPLQADQLRTVDVTLEVRAMGQDQNRQPGVLPRRYWLLGSESAAAEILLADARERPEELLGQLRALSKE